MVRGQQYRYTGHVVNFNRDTPRIYRKYPLVPNNADIVILCPPRDAQHPEHAWQSSRSGVMSLSNG